MSGRSGCGLCGKESLEQALMPLPRLADTPKPSLGAIQKAVNSLRGLQPIQQQTSASHAAVWCDAEGNLGLLREDVGRHNALDKLIGALAGQRRNSAPPNAASQSGFVLITSRASYEIVAKTAIAGVGSLVALSAPTSLAVETALRCNLNLIAFAGAAPMVYAESTACSP
ncbi:formate dehydrogenase accessory protein FdhD [Luminiphilus syltensis NOR5-1B]|uniref:Formate dehydrogenase accessory protein FdhD n=2 Tax=Luminiphilus TaxID=1341118 RepID=B8KXI5_9GAMM|nr:formate dehydrogenase accessory protein FdhD [Luminiphilus syltensis NOR5-1B]